MMLSDPIWNGVDWLKGAWVHHGLPLMLATLVALFGVRRSG
jgi:hypothetical protein